MMTRKHFQKVAEVVAITRAAYGRSDDLAGVQACDTIANGLADIFGEDNPNFDRGRFLRACRGDDARR